MVRTSATKGTGMDELLETILTVAELNEYTANLRKNDFTVEVYEDRIVQLAQAEADGNEDGTVGDYLPLVRQAMDAMDVVELAASGDYEPAHGAVYPGGSLGDHLKLVAQMVKADLGLHVATIDFGGMMIPVRFSPTAPDLDLDADGLEGFEITLAANASEEGKLYGSIGPREIATAFADAWRRATGCKVAVRRR